jgi:hypothetical protein
VGKAASRRDSDALSETRHQEQNLQRAATRAKLAAKLKAYWAKKKSGKK